VESHQKVSRAEKDETRVLEWEECPISGTFMEEMADSSQRFARAILSQQEVDVYLDNVEAGAMEERMARALGMEPGRACTEDGTALTHTVEGMQASVVAGCADLFDDDASAISGPRCRGGSADGGELGVGKRTRRSDLGPDVPCVLAAAGEASTTACAARATTCRWTGRPRPCAQGRGRRRGERGGGWRRVGARRRTRPSAPSIVYGLDVPGCGILLPQTDVGNWMYFRNTGAYTLAAASRCNGVPTTVTF
jgi:hypothetical protein